MLQSISWGQFIKFTAVLTVGYYAYLGWLFYGRQAMAFLAGKKEKEEAKPLQPVAGGMTGQVGPGGGVGGAAGGKAEVVGAGGQMVPAGAGTAMSRSERPLGGESGTSGGDGGQPTLFRGEQVAAGQSPELFKVMEKVIALLKGVVSQGVANGIQEEELTDHIRQVLTGYHQLKRTPYQVAINNFLIRTCTSNFSLLLDEERLEILWR